MGQGLPKAVTSIALRRCAGKCIRVGVAEMNGWRMTMEDSHVVHIRDNWGFFGVFDGHGGSQCSTFVARRLTEELESCGAPEDDEAISALALRLDKEFLATGQPSGSTGTFAFITPPSTPGGKYHLRVGNVGDSRVLLGRADGTLVEGQGTDGGITTDHKPDHPSERTRILRVGGTVEQVMGVSRVNGELAVSRAFGDAQYKQVGDPETSDHPVSAVPEIVNLECDSADFVMLVCDGISEGDFPNREVVALVAECLRNGGPCPDPGEAAAAVCRKALKAGSKDNLSCMVVLLGQDSIPEEAVAASQESAALGWALLPGPFDAPEHPGFRKAYSAMAEHAGLNLAQAVELRHSTVQDALNQVRDGNPPRAEMRNSAQDENGECDLLSSEDALQEELTLFGDGPPPELGRATEQRVEWFGHWLENKSGESGAGDGDQMSRGHLVDLLQRHPHLREVAESQGLLPGGQPARMVRVQPVEVLRPAVENHPALKWDDRLQAACSKQGVVLRVDQADGTSQVRFPQPLGFTAWFPTCTLEASQEGEEDEEEGRLVRVASLDVLKPAVEEHPALKWWDNLTDACGNEGIVLQDDPSDGTSKVKFRPPAGFTAWLPTATLTDVNPEEHQHTQRRQTWHDIASQEHGLEDAPPAGANTVRVAPVDELRLAVEANATLRWSEELASLGGEEGERLEEDLASGTCEVSFQGGLGTRWLPTSVLSPVDSDSKRQRTG